MSRSFTDHLEVAFPRGKADWRYHLVLRILKEEAMDPNADSIVQGRLHHTISAGFVKRLVEEVEARVLEREREAAREDEPRG